ncbi:MAG: Fe-S cluster assembly protein SufD [Betaproteobacteria bacterium]|nr:Fe-S cluster assembly protein SufD [Betaproteobacteria bacterium]
MISDQARNHFVSEFERCSASFAGSSTPWIERMRRLALEQFAATGFPSPREEEWKYTNVEPLARRRFEVPPRSLARITADQVAALAFGLDGVEHLLVFVDGYYMPLVSKLGALPGGTVIASLGDVLAREPWRVQPFLAGNAADTPFAALNTAFAAEGAFIHLPPGVAVDAPIHLLYLTATAEAVTHPLTLVIAEQGARAVVLEHHSGADGTSYFTNAATRVVVGANASVEHYKLQQEGDSAFHVAAIQVRQERDSRYWSHSLALGGALARTDINAALNGTGCECTLNGLYVAGGDQLLDHHTRIEHASPHGRSRELYRGILDGRARGVFAGRVIVHKGAQKTDAHLANHNLLLSPQAEVDTKPQLEIYADDVKCGHGTTVGQLDENVLFYLRSRGIPRDLAGALLTYAFVHDVIGRIELAPLRTRIENIVLQRLPEGRLIREHA